MVNESATGSTSLEALSALADGELDDAESACARWCSDPVARASWHAYHLIGDVLRSPDLASNAERDAAFLERIRAQLCAAPIAAPAEPIVIPGAAAAYAGAAAAALQAGGDARRLAARSRIPAGARAGRRRGWIGSAALAAGFALVAGGVVLERSPSVPADATLAEASPVAPATLPAAAEMPAAAPPTLVVDGRLIRDARLDRYLAAHKQFAGSSALGLPSAFLHGAAAERPAR